MPALDVDALRRHIEKAALAPVYLLYGDDVRLIERFVEAFEALVDPADRPFAVERIYAGEPGGSPLDIAGAANVFPMLGDRRIVIVLRGERLLKPARAARTADRPDAEDSGEPEDAEGGGAMDHAPLDAYLDNPSASTVLVVVASGLDRSRKLTKHLLQRAQAVEFGGLGGDSAALRREARREGVLEVQHECERAGRTIDPSAAQMLVDGAGGEISKLRGDVERLLLYTEGQTKISRSDVEEVMTAETDVDDWAVVNAIGDGDTARALRETGLRFDRGDSPHALVGQLRWWVAQRLSAAAPPRVKPSLDALLRTDLALKSSGGDSRVLVERLVVELTGKQLPKPSWGPGRR